MNNDNELVFYLVQAQAHDESWYCAKLPGGGTAIFVDSDAAQRFADSEWCVMRVVRLAGTP